LALLLKEGPLKLHPTQLKKKRVHLLCPCNYSYFSDVLLLVKSVSGDQAQIRAKENLKSALRERSEKLGPALANVLVADQRASLNKISELIPVYV
jgi:hypothetical protein